MDIVSVINYKGGLGKTTATANLGSAARMDRPKRPDDRGTALADRRRALQSAPTRRRTLAFRGPSATTKDLLRPSSVR